jgi:hypothetical protein
MFEFERIFKYILKNVELTHCSVFPVAVSRGYNRLTQDQVLVRLQRNYLSLNSHAYDY